jgi:EpsI family protein
MSISRRNLLVGGVGLACSGLAWAGAREAEMEPLPDGVLDRIMPSRFGSWRAVEAGGVILPPESEMSDRTYNDVLVRVYENGAGNAVALLLAYGSLQGRDMQLHRPELCYPAAGFEIRGAETLDLRLPNEPVISARLLDTASQSRAEQVLYWTRIGREFPTTQLAQRWSVLRQNLGGEVPDGILVRTSTVAADAPAALPVLRSFIETMMDESPPAARKLLVGQA